MEKVKLIKGNPERAEEIRKTLENWGGENKEDFNFKSQELYYYVNVFGVIESLHEKDDYIHELISEGKAEIYELPPLKPKFDFKPFDKVLVRDYDDMNWFCDFFSNLETDKDRIEAGYIYGCIGSAFKQCIKYEGNEEFFGTKNNPK